MSLTDSVNLARQRVLNGETLSIEEQRQLIAELRAARGVTPPSEKPAAKKSTGAKKPALSEEELDAQLDNALNF